MAVDKSAWIKAWVCLTFLSLPGIKGLTMKDYLSLVWFKLKIKLNLMIKSKI